MSKTMNLGKVSVTPKGEWKESVAYDVLDIVSYNNSVWISKKANQGETPSGKSEYWYLCVDNSAKIPEQLDSGVFLPDEIYVAVGRTIELYNKNIFPAAERYHFEWKCPVGKSFGRKFSITGKNGNVGAHSLELRIYNDKNELVWEKTSTLKINYASLADAYVMCPIGDVHTAGRAWLLEILNLSYGNVMFDGVLASNYEMNHEGRSGWTSSVYTSSATHLNSDSGTVENNPFWNDQGFSWSHYVSSSGKSNISAVQLFFGERELVNTPAETVANNIKAMIRSIRMSDSTMPIFVVLPPCFGSQDGMSMQELECGVDFSVSFKYALDNIIINGAKTIYESIRAQNYTNVFFVPLTTCYDSENHFETTEVAVNPRSSKKEIVPTGAIIPTEEGYKQMADVMFSSYCIAFMNIEGNYPV